jgi:hypothetical protein
MKVRVNMSDEYNLTWEQADRAMKLGAVVKTKGYLPLRFEDDGYEFLDDKVWRNLPTWAELSELMYKIHSIPKCRNNYYPLKKAKSICIDNLMKKLFKFKDEEPKMSEELMSFDEAVVWVVRNPGNRLFFITKDGDADCILYSHSTGGFLMMRKDLTLYMAQVNNLTDCKFSKTPIKIRPKVNGLGLDDKFNIGFIKTASRDDDKITQALQTYIELLKHPLVVATSQHSRKQYYIDTHNPGGEVKIRSYEFSELRYKLCMLSPFFHSKEDCEKAIADIGKDRLLFMFKALKGL